MMQGSADPRSDDIEAAVYDLVSTTIRMIRGAPPSASGVGPSLGPERAVDVPAPGPAVTISEDLRDVIVIERIAVAADRLDEAISRTIMHVSR